MYRCKRGDLLLISLLLLLAVGLFWVGKSGIGSHVIIVSQGTRFRYSLSKNRQVPLAAKLGPVRIAISNQSVAIEETHCPHKICQKMGRINKVGQSLICVPQKIEISIIGVSRKVDAVCH